MNGLGLVSLCMTWFILTRKEIENDLLSVIEFKNGCGYVPFSITCYLEPRK
jgi:hypothetical protein